MSDFPPRVEALREMIQAAMPEADFLIEEIWKHIGPATDGFGHAAPPELARFWRVTIQAGTNLPSVIDVPDKLVLESSKTAVVLVQRSSNRIVKLSSRKAPSRIPFFD